jgi:hypothetical protein
MLLVLALSTVAALAARKRVNARTVALAVTALVFWLGLALTRVQVDFPRSFEESRYLYPGAVLLVLLLVEAVDGIRIPWPAVAAIGVGVAVVIAFDLRKLHWFSGQVRTTFAAEASMMRRAQCDRHLPATVALDPAQAPGVTAGPYRAAVRVLGVPTGQSC